MADLFTEQNITKTLEDNYMPYAMSVIVSRAIPEIDGFKPSHRKLLYTMYTMGLLNPSRPRTKSANVVGQTMKLNPHGDMAIYETMVRLTRSNGSLLYPFVDSKGNFGKQYSRDMAFAASRYTEVKLEPLCTELFADIDKDTVDFVDNYDGTLKEPVLLPVTFPSILVNANQGIAVGMASNLCSFNLKEVIKTTIKLMKHPNANIMDTLPAPDFPGGGQLIYKAEEMEKIYKTGRGSFKMRSKYRYDKKNSCIEIYEIPYSTTIEAIIDKLADLVKQNKVRDITDVRDETDLNGLKITIDIKKSCDPDKLMSRLFMMTPLQESFSCNFNILIGDMPKVMGVREIITEWIAFRIECIKRQLYFDIQKIKDKLHLLYGLSKILLDIDKAVRIVRETEHDKDVVPNLMEGFDIDKIQAEFVAEIKLRNLNKEYILNRTKEIGNLEEELKKNEQTLNSEELIKDKITQQLKDVAKKYGEDRKTEIIFEEHIETVDQDSFIEDFPLKIFYTRDGYLKKISLVSLRSSGEQKLKEGDKLKGVVETTNKSELLMFSDQQNVYKVKTYDLPDSKASNLGDYLPNLLGMEEGEKILKVMDANDYKGHVLFVFESGKMAKVPLKSYVTKTNRKRLSNAYSAASPIVDILYLEQDMDLVVFSTKDKVLAFNTENINPKATRDSQGVNVMLLKKNAKVAKIRTFDEVNFNDVNYYKTKNIPAVGCFLRKDDTIRDQMTFLSEE